MNQIGKKNIFFRYTLIIGVILVFSATIIGKLFSTTVIDSHKWNEKAMSYISTEEDVEPKRGSILAANGTVLATDLNYYTVRIDWKTEGIKGDTLMKYLPALADSLEAFYPTKKASEWRAELKTEFNRAPQKKKRAYLLFRRITSTEFKRLKSFPYFNLAVNKNGLYREDRMLRIKPYGSLASRSIGSVGQDQQSSSIRGRSGLEKALDSLLYGKKGKAKKIQLTSTIKSWEELPAVKGYDILTTIDVDIQDITEEALYNMLVECGSRWGTTVVMEVATGEIKAISNLEWNSSFNDYVEGSNHAVLGYEPGSVMKPISMMIALEDGLVDDVEEVLKTGHVFPYAGGKPISDSHGYPSMPVRQVIESSSNIGMTKIILRGYEKNPGKFYSRLKGIGFFEPLNTGIAGEQIPFVDSLGNKNWDKIALTRMSYGYSTKIPPMSTLAIFNAFANNGRYIRPRLVNALMLDGEVVERYKPTYVREQVCSKENAAKIRSMLHDVVWGEHGTAKMLRSDEVDIAGKTGTSYLVENGKYSYKKRYSFCGFFPYENPKYSCITVISGADRGAGRSSGTVLKEIAHKMYSRGMLGGVDYTKEIKDSETMRKGMLYASSNRDEDYYDDMRDEFSLNNLDRIVRKNDNSGGVPNVIGLGLYDALNLLENSGLNVSVKGSGYVYRQSKPHGARIKKGDLIEISLKQ
ncbi:MAG: penicillin-binding protein [Bacteroidales bacterium]